MMKNNYFHLETKKGDVLSFVFLYCIIMIQTLLITSFGKFFPQMTILLSKLVNIMIVVYFIYGFFIRLTIRKLIYFSVVSLVTLSFFWQQKGFSAFIQLLLLSAAVPSTILSSHKIVNIFGLAMGSTTGVTIVLSLMGYLPISGTASQSMFSSYQEIVYFLGFTHPNTLGTFITMIFATIAYSFYKKYKWGTLLLSVILFFLNIGIGADTAAVGIVILETIIMLPNKLNKFYKILYLLPSILTLFAVWLSVNNTSLLGEFFNNKVSSRPNIWNAYIFQYPIRFINLSPHVDTSSSLGILGNGALDGSYIYILIFLGTLSWIIYNFIFIILIKFGVELKDKALLGVALLTIITAFPESHMIMFYENIFLLFIGFFQYPIYMRRKLLEC